MPLLLLPALAGCVDSTLNDLHIEKWVDGTLREVLPIEVSPTSNPIATMCASGYTHRSESCTITCNGAQDSLTVDCVDTTKLMVAVTCNTEGPEPMGMQSGGNLQFAMSLDSSNQLVIRWIILAADLYRNMNSQGQGPDNKLWFNGNLSVVASYVSTSATVSTLDKLLINPSRTGTDLTIFHIGMDPDIVTVTPEPGKALERCD